MYHLLLQEGLLALDFLTDWKLWVNIGRVIEFSSIDSFNVVVHPVFMFSLTTLS